MTEYAFFLQKSRLMEENDDSNVGGINICPSLQWFQIPTLSQAELSSPNGLRVWGKRQKFNHDITFLLVLAEEEATGDKKYGLLTIWVNPSQTRVHSMEKAVGKLIAWASSEPNWPYTLVQLHEGTHYVPLHKEGHLGILPQRGVEVTPCQQISQLEVHQLLITGPQVVYPIGLNGCEEPIITSLIETLANGISLTGGKPIYLEIHIPPSLMKEPERKVLPICKVSTIMITSPHKSTPCNWKERAVWPWREGISYPKWCWKHLVMGLKTQLWGGQTQWSSLCLHLTSQRNSFSW